MQDPIAIYNAQASRETRPARLVQDAGHSNKIMNNMNMNNLALDSKHELLKKNDME